MDQLKRGILSMGFQPSDLQLSKLRCFYELLTERNQVMNLTTITEWKDVVEKHFLDSMAISLLEKGSETDSDEKENDYGSRLSSFSGKTVLDFGTGAGFPGIPLAIFYPESEFLLMDSLQKRVRFLEEVIVELSLTNAKAIHGRGEEMAHQREYRESFDLVVSRAVANLSTLSELCLPFVKIGGAFVSYKSDAIEEELMAADTAVRVLGGDRPLLSRIQIPETELIRSFVIIPKKKGVPKSYPRKPGTPQKKPLR